MGQRRARTKAWFAAHVKDAQVRKATRSGYRSRAAFKLMELDDRHKLLAGANSVVDVGASPGSWSQVIRQRVPKGARIVAVDLLVIEPIDGVFSMKSDIRDRQTSDTITEKLGQRVDLVTCDAAPDISGVRDRDEARFVELHEATMELCRRLCAKALVMKTFTGQPLDEARSDALALFNSVRISRPSATKKHSKECYLVAKRAHRN